MLLDVEEHEPPRRRDAERRRQDQDCFLGDSVSRRLFFRGPRLADGDYRREPSVDWSDAKSRSTNSAESGLFRGKSVGRLARSCSTAASARGMPAVTDAAEDRDTPVEVLEDVKGETRNWFTPEVRCTVSQYLE